MQHSLFDDWLLYLFPFWPDSNGKPDEEDEDELREDMYEGMVGCKVIKKE